MIYAEWSFRTSKSRGDGATERDHEESASRQMAMFGLKRRVIPDAPNEPYFPMELRYLWAWFHELTAGIEAPGFGAPVVTWEAVAAWCSLCEVELEPWEARTLVELGQVRAMILLEKPKGQIGVKR
jgi:hypothetical protein